MKNTSYYSFVRSDLVGIVSSISGNVLDVGCGRGSTMKFLENQGGTNVYGIDVDAESIEYAKNDGLNVCIHNINDGTFFYDNIIFNYIIFGDVLEHTNDPWNVLESAKNILSDDGIILISLPNIKHYTVVNDLIFRDKFTYVEAGILDKTHLRFFTYTEAIKLIKDCGYEVLIERYVRPRKMRFFYKLLLKIMPNHSVMNFWTYQFLFAIKKKTNF